jgi:hypothetical protein
MMSFDILLSVFTSNTYVLQFRKCAFIFSHTQYFKGHCYTDKRTDVWSRNFMIWKIDFGLLAVAWAGPWEKGVWADSEQLFWVVFSIFHGQKKKILNFFYIVASALKSYIK